MRIFTRHRGCVRAFGFLLCWMVVSPKQVHRQQQVDDGTYCALCPGGLELLADKEPDPLGNPGATCQIMDDYYKFAWPEARNYTLNDPGTCRSDVGYNFYSDLCCRTSIPRYECEYNIHQLLSNTPYNTAVPPIVGVDEPLNVSVEFQYQALEHIEVEDGTATIFFAVIFVWNDPRLTWDVVDGDTCSNVIDLFTGHEIEKTNIWVPDFDIKNQVDGFQATPDFKATIHSDGTVHWAIAGGMKVFCAFTGLASIPFDTLGCQLLFGAHTRSYSKQLNYKLLIPEYISVGAFELSYNEWTLDPYETEQGYAFDENAIYYNVYFKRAKSYYVQNIVIPTILLTYVSFLTFMLDLRVGERLGFGMALTLVVVAQQIVTADLSPVSDQRLWLDKFVSWSFYWVLFGLVQSAFVGFLYYLREDRQARKENKRVSMMTMNEREMMMEAAEERKALTDHPEEAVAEADQLAFPAGPSKGEEDVLKKDLELPHSDPTPRNASCIKTCSFRAIDMVSLVFALSTYTTFVITMFSSINSSFWLQNEPRWFSESDFAYPTSYYDAKDPNS